MKRIKYGTFKLLSPDKQKQHKRRLQEKYKVKHKAKLKVMNRDSFERYKKNHANDYEKTCKICGKIFKTYREIRVICDDCVKNRPISESKCKKEERRQREINRILGVKKIYELWKSGITQEKLAEMYNISQSGISSKIRRYLKRIKDEI